MMLRAGVAGTAVGAAESCSTEGWGWIGERCKSRKFGFTTGFPVYNSGVPSQGSLDVLTMNEGEKCEL